MQDRHGSEIGIIHLADDLGLSPSDQAAIVIALLGEPGPDAADALAASASSSFLGEVAARPIALGTAAALLTATKYRSPPAVHTAKP